MNNNYQELAEAVISAVANYIGVPYSSPEGVTVNTYTVQRGDTLYSIAAKLGTTVQELTTLNNLTSSNLSIGQVLRIPTEEIQEDEEDIYIVKRGDSLYSIARDNGTTVDEIKNLNNLTSNILSVGQLLKLPSALVPDDSYTVQKGDSLYAIANRFGTTVDALKRVNNLTNNTLSIGQILKIPSIENEDNGTSYTVKSGDSLYSIAREFNTTVDDIKNINGLTSNLLSIGQVLTIPMDTSLDTTYTVQSGDSLYSIARKFGTDVNTLKELNNLTSNLLSIGQILIVRG